MDVRLQDAIERLERTNDLDVVLNYISGRRDVYLSMLSTVDLTDVTMAAKTQGMIQAMDEVLRIPEDAKHAKQQRTKSDE